jgi:hypothetical protein
MRRLARLVPTAEGIARNKAKIAGFAAGVVGPLLLVALFTVIYTGHGLFVQPQPLPPIYPNF